MDLGQSQPRSLMRRSSAAGGHSGVLTIILVFVASLVVLTLTRNEANRLREAEEYIQEQVPMTREIFCLRYGLSNEVRHIDVMTLKALPKPDGTKPKALVTGAAGFIGSHVARIARDLDMDVIAVDDMSGGFKKNVPEGVTFVKGDLKDPHFIDELFEHHGPFTYVYHLAAYAAEGLSHFIRGYNYRNNLVATMQLLNACVRSENTEVFVFTSSIAVYGAGQTPMTEETTPIPEDPYGVSKYACELDLKAAHEMFGQKYIVFRPHNVYGPGQNLFDRYRNVIGIFLNQLSHGKPMTVFGDGTQTRKFSYIDDVAVPIAVSPLMEHMHNEVFNVGGDQAYTVNFLAKVTAYAWSTDLFLDDKTLVHLDKRNEVEHAESSHSKIHCYLPSLPRPVPLETGMSRMVEWAKKEGAEFAAVEFSAVEVKKNMPPSWVRPDLQEKSWVEHDEKENLVEQSISTS